MELILHNTLQEKQKVLPALEEFARHHHLPSRVLQAADLALEEHLTNLIAYAHDDPERHKIVVRLTLEGGWLQVEVEDDGRPFNPLSQPPPDTSLPLSEKPVGGLGIHLMRSVMDEAGYHRDGRKNVLTLRKKLD